jgi:hypothetical protein
MSRKTLESYFKNMPSCNSLECHQCFSTSVPLKMCANCKSVAYCSEGCQKKNWNGHKVLCKELKEYKAKVSRTQEELKNNSRKNVQKETSTEEFSYKLEALGNVPVLFNTMSLEEIKKYYENSLGDMNILNLMGCVFQTSFTEDETLCITIIKHIAYIFSGTCCNDPFCAANLGTKRIHPEFEWFIWS